MDRPELWDILRRDGAYRTHPGAEPTALRRLWSRQRLAYHIPATSTVIRAALHARFREFSMNEWADYAFEIIQTIERCGARWAVDGLEHVQGVRGVCVMIGNHMSSVETLTMPLFVLPFTHVTVVVKESLMKYPFFGTILTTLGMIPVTRSNPREDLKQVVSEGDRFLKDGRSVVVFPQATRTLTFQPEIFSSIGIRLAAQSGVPVVPVAIKTDFLRPGGVLKDFGAIDNRRTLRFGFGEAFEVGKDKKAAHQRVMSFIAGELDRWNAEDEAD